MRCYIVLILVFLQFPFIAFAAETADKDSFIKVFSSCVGSSFSIRHWDEKKADYNYDSVDYLNDDAWQQGFALGYKGLSFSFGFHLYDGYSGAKSSYDISSRYYRQKFGIEYIFQNARNFRLQDPDKYGFGTVMNEQILRKDVRQINNSLNSYYVFSDTFSVKASFDRTDVQKEWAFSFFLMGSVNYNSLSAQWSLIPQSVNTVQNFGIESGYTGGKYYSIGILPGAGLTLPFYKFFATAIFFVGPGFMHDESNFENRNRNRNSNYCNILVNMKGALGYNGEFIMPGISVNAHSIDAGNIYGSKSYTGIQFLEVYIDAYVSIPF